MILLGHPRVSYRCFQTTQISHHSANKSGINGKVQRGSSGTHQIIIRK